MLITTPGRRSSALVVEGAHPRVPAPGVEPLLREDLGLRLVGAGLAAVVGVRRVLPLVGPEEERARRVVVALELREGAAAVRVRARHELVVRGAPVVVVLQGVAAGPDLLPHVHGGDVLQVGRRGLVAERDRGRAQVVGLRRVGEDEDRLSAALLEVEGDPGVLQHAAHEREVALAVLHPVLALLVRGGELLLGLDAPLAEEREHDVELRLLLEHPVVAPLRGEPQRGDDAQRVGGRTPLFDAGLLERVAEARPRPLVRAGPDREARRTAHDGVEVHVGVLAHGTTSDATKSEDIRSWTVNCRTSSASPEATVTETLPRCASAPRDDAIVLASPPSAARPALTAPGRRNRRVRIARRAPIGLHGRTCSCRSPSSCPQRRLRLCPSLPSCCCSRPRRPCRSWSCRS